MQFVLSAISLLIFFQSIIQHHRRRSGLLPNRRIQRPKSNCNELQQLFPPQSPNIRRPTRPSWYVLSISGHKLSADRNIGQLLRGATDDNGNLNKAALMVGIKLDLEAEVHLTARVRGDIVVGLY